jgi:hypothetical protein
LAFKWGVNFLSYIKCMAFSFHQSELRSEIYQRMLMMSLVRTHRKQVEREIRALGMEKYYLVLDF